MFTALVLQNMTNDAEILLTRALKGKSVSCFGVDGLGQHGTSDVAQTYAISRFDVDLFDIDAGFPGGLRTIYLDGYSASQFGHRSTDQNFKISLNKLLLDQHIDPECWDWAELVEQQEHAIVLELDFDKLIAY